MKKLKFSDMVRKNQQFVNKRNSSLQQQQRSPNSSSCFDNTIPLASIIRGGDNLGPLQLTSPRQQQSSSIKSQQANLSYSNAALSPRQKLYPKMTVAKNKPEMPTASPIFVQCQQFQSPEKMVAGNQDFDQYMTDLVQKADSSGKKNRYDVLNKTMAQTQKWKQDQQNLNIAEEMLKRENTQGNLDQRQQATMRLDQQRLQQVNKSRYQSSNQIFPGASGGNIDNNRGTPGKQLPVAPSLASPRPSYNSSQQQLLLDSASITRAIRQRAIERPGVFSKQEQNLVNQYKHRQQLSQTVTKPKSVPQSSMSNGPIRREDNDELTMLDEDSRRNSENFKIVGLQSPPKRSSSTMVIPKEYEQEADRSVNIIKLSQCLQNEELILLNESDSDGGRDSANQQIIRPTPKDSQLGSQLNELGPVLEEMEECSPGLAPRTRNKNSSFNIYKSFEKLLNSPEKNKEVNKIEEGDKLELLVSNVEDDQDQIEKLKADKLAAEKVAQQLEADIISQNLKDLWKSTGPSQKMQNVTETSNETESATRTTEKADRPKLSKKRKSQVSNRQLPPPQTLKSYSEHVQDQNGTSKKSKAEMNETTVTLDSIESSRKVTQMSCHDEAVSNTDQMHNRIKEQTREAKTFSGSPRNGQLQKVQKKNSTKIQQSNPPADNITQHQIASIESSNQQQLQQQMYAQQASAQNQNQNSMTQAQLLN